jgi:hypothetical protein
MKTRIGSAAVLAVVGICPLAIGTAQAHADAESDFVSMLKKWGYTVTEKNTKTLVGMGNAICEDLHAGTSKDDEATLLHQNAPAATGSLSQAQARNFVTVAQRNLCPDTLST